VPVDRGWDRETFLAWTCRKAGLPPDTWKKPDCVLLAFTALVFGEDEGEGESARQERSPR
jgi:AMMECR1 domain-containing protein